MKLKNTIAVIIVNPLNEILYQLRDDKPEIFNPNVWGLIGGSVEGNEFPQEAAYRELEEEIEYTPSNLSFFKKYSIAGDQVHVFVVRVLFNEPSAVVLHEGQRLGFFNKQQFLEICKTKKICTDLDKIVRDFYEEELKI